jgi:hypothetical protein
VLNVAINNRKVLKEALIKTVAYWAFIAVIWILILYSPARLGSTATREVLLCLGFAFAREIGHIQLSHITGEVYIPLNLPVLLVLGTLAGNTMLHAYG